MISCRADQCPTLQGQMDVSKMCSPAGLKPQADEMNKPLTGNHGMVHACCQQNQCTPGVQRSCMADYKGGKTVLITSTRTSSLLKSAIRSVEPLAATTPADPADRPLDLPLWIYHEESHDGQPLPGAIREWANAKHVCLVDLFHVVPELHHWLHSNASCIDAFYKIAGHSEPFEKTLVFKSAKVLVRKTAAIFHAVHSLPNKATVLWVDFDVAPSAEAALDWTVFWNFVQQHDVSYLPFVHAVRTVSAVLSGASFPPHGGPLPNTTRCTDPGRDVDKAALGSTMWVVDTGVLALVVSDVTRELAALVLRHYDSTASELASKCLCQLQSSANEAALLSVDSDADGPQNETACSNYRGYAVDVKPNKWCKDRINYCRHEYIAKRCRATCKTCKSTRELKIRRSQEGCAQVRRSLYLDDLFVWTLYLQADLSPAESMPVLPRLRSPLSHGWFAVGNRSQMLSQKQRDVHQRMGKLCPTALDRHHWRCFECASTSPLSVCKSSFFMSTECPGASSFTSPFNTFTYFQHKINQGAGDYTARAAAWQRTTRNASAATRNSSAAMNMYLRNGCICRRCTMPPRRPSPVRTNISDPYKPSPTGATATQRTARHVPNKTELQAKSSPARVH